MSKYSRTRKAICRVSHISKWIVNREYFRKAHINTWKESYKDAKKEHLKCCNKLPTGYSYINNRFIKFPCKYREALKHFTIWQVC